MGFRIFTLACFFILFSFSLNAQTIIVNGSSVSVSNTDVTFPFWLDSGSSIEIGDHVISISALEFNIVPNNNGNSLVYVQTKLVTTLETVPNGKTWKLEGVLIDSTINNITNSSQVIVSGGLSVIDLSDESPNTMNFGAALDYCDNLIEGGNEDWIIPNWEDLTYAIGGLINIPTRNNKKLWTSTFSSTATYNYKSIATNGDTWAHPASDLNYTRCIRKGSVSVSSNSSGSNTTSSLGNGMPTMISNLSDSSMSFMASTFYCSNLVESGYDDWILPTIDQLTYAISGGCNFNDNRDGYTIWTRTLHTHNFLFTLRDSYYNPSIGGNYTVFASSYTEDSQDLNHCRCVR